MKLQYFSNKILLYKYIICLFSLLFFNLATFASFTALKDSTVLKDTTLLVSNRNLHFRPLPIMTYLPETKLAFGALAVFLFKAGNDSSTRTSNVDFAVVYTMKKQLIIDPMFSIFTKKEKYFIKGALLYTEFPEFFYGIGKGTSADLKEDISYNTVRVNLKVLRKIKKNLFAGLQYEYYNTFDVKYPSGSNFRHQKIEGKLGSITSGFGPALVYDSRNSILTPTRGHYFEISNLNYNHIFGSQYDFVNYIIDFRKYIKINKRGIIALQSFANINFGRVPFKQLATVGGNRIMRGYYNGRFRDKNVLVLQAELRQHLFWRLGYTLFVDIGNVTANFATDDFTNIIYTMGGGIRYKLIKEENINIRLDLGFGQNTRGLYVTLSEAF